MQVQGRKKIVRKKAKIFTIRDRSYAIVNNCGTWVDARVVNGGGL